MAHLTGNVCSLQITLHKWSTYTATMPTFQEQELISRIKGINICDVKLVAHVFK